MSVTSSDNPVDLAIIGSGSGNTLVTPFWEDRRVVIAESGVFGGTCLNVGCIPTKMFVRPASLARAPEEAARLGVTLHTEAVDWPAIRDRIFGRIDPISASGERYRRDEQAHVELISQRVRLDGTHAIVAEDGTRVAARQLVIAAGSRPVLPEFPGIGLPEVHTSETVMRLAELPTRVLVIGGGAIASEFASIFSGLGSEVIQVHRRAHLLSHAEPEIAERFTEAAGRRWGLRLSSAVRRIDPADDGDGVVVELKAATDEAKSASGSGTASERVQVDIVLVAIGRRPNSDLVGAAEAGLDLHPDGRIAVDAEQRVLSGGAPVPGLYALGDVCTPFKLKHVANHEARVVAHNLEHPDDLRAARHEAVPEAIFSAPEVATVGETQAEAAARIGAEHVTAFTKQYGDTAYGWALEDTEGLCTVVADRRNGQVLGAHIVGHEASMLIQLPVMAMSFGIDAHTVARGQYWPHPSLMEVVENALLGLDVPRGERPPL
ncbi:NADPH-dependent mycothiol reductase Mtr [Leucobacter sp. 7(1)]|uniref:mycothione reductase n=1 Tax=Leucobacter sp. 7(1) TaxID=1255613 RepID=UPI00097E82CF|nr:mycothione reductase [Leucobacter sp. 7(1)]SJN08643.1 NADPH-dependent mycothiol reductase Mtr [Leucobacter sp. 7(1)]